MQPRFGSKQRGGAAHDRQADAEALLDIALRIAELVVLAEDRLTLVRRDAGTRVPYLQLHVGAATARAEPDSACACIAHRIGEQVPEDLLEQHAVAGHPKVG